MSTNHGKRSFDSVLQLYSKLYTHSYDVTTLLLNNNFYLLLYLNDRQDMTWQLMWDPKPHHRYITSRDSFSRTPHLEVKNAMKNFLGHIPCLDSSTDNPGHSVVATSQLDTPPRQPNRYYPTPLYILTGPYVCVKRHQNDICQKNVSPLFQPYSI